MWEGEIVGWTGLEYKSGEEWVGAEADEEDVKR